MAGKEKSLGTNLTNRFGQIPFQQLPLDTGRILNVISIIVGLGIWELLGRSLQRTLLAPPSEVAVTWFEMIVDGTLPTALAASLQHMMLGYVLAVFTAIPLGFLIGRSDIVRWALNPYIDAIYATPTVAYIPLIIVWFGLGFKARVFMVFIMCFFEMLIDTEQGISSISEEYLDVGRSFDLSWWQQQRNVLLPASLPYVFTGLRIGVGRAVRGMIVAELFLAVVNLGALLEGSGASFDTSTQLAIIATISVLGVVCQNGVKYAERLAIPWHGSASGGH